MLRTMMKSKIHRATVTHADLHYVGSVTVDSELMAAADLLEGEQVAIVDITNGARLETYVIAGEPGSGVIGINGAAAHLVNPGDLVILIAYAQMEDAEASLGASLLEGSTSDASQGATVSQGGADRSAAADAAGASAGESSPADTVASGMRVRDLLPFSPFLPPVGVFTPMSIRARVRKVRCRWSDACRRQSDEGVFMHLRR